MNDDEDIIELPPLVGKRERFYHENYVHKVERALMKLALAVGDDSGCAKLTVPCTCGKAAELTAAHAEAAYLVRSIQEAAMPMEEK